MPATNGHTTIGEFLKELREESGMSQGTAGTHIGVHGTHLGQMELGKYEPSPKWLKGLAKVYFQHSPSACVKSKSVKALYLHMMVIAGYLTEADLAITQSVNRREKLQTELDTARATVAELEAKIQAYDVLFGTPGGGPERATHEGRVK